MASSSSLRLRLLALSVFALLVALAAAAPQELTRDTKLANLSLEELEDQLQVCT
jgi:hypothetical protein